MYFNMIDSDSQLEFWPYCNTCFQVSIIIQKRRRFIKEEQKRSSQTQGWHAAGRLSAKDVREKKEEKEKTNIGMKP